MRPVFNVRIYGLLIENDQILVSDERHHHMNITKFPGGGLEFGEGPKDCIIREFAEELGIRVKVTRHFYTVDFFQPSAFNPDQQVISIYYLVEQIESQPIPVKATPFEFENIRNGEQVFRWIRLDKLGENDLTFPIDKTVARMISVTL